MIRWPLGKPNILMPKSVNITFNVGMITRLPVGRGVIYPGIQTCALTMRAVATSLSIDPSQDFVRAIPIWDME